jgi:hypothetical protein
MRSVFIPVLMLAISVAFVSDPPKFDREAMEKKLAGDWYVRDAKAAKGKRPKDSTYNYWSLFQPPRTRPNWPKNTGVFTDNENESVQTYGTLILNADADPMWLDFRFRDMDTEYVWVGILRLDKDGDPHWVLNRKWTSLAAWEKAKGKVNGRPKAFEDEKKRPVGYRLER